MISNTNTVTAVVVVVIAVVVFVEVTVVVVVMVVIGLLGVYDKNESVKMMLLKCHKAPPIQLRLTYLRQIYTWTYTRSDQGETDPTCSKDLPADISEFYFALPASYHFQKHRKRISVSLVRQQT